MIYIWLIFTTIFVCLAAYHFWEAFSKVAHIESKGNEKSINGVPVGISEFVGDFNTYIDGLNRRNMIVNIVTGAGYTAAALTALFSFWLSLPMLSVPADEIAQEDMNALYLEVAVESHREGIESLGDPAFSAYVFNELDTRCPFYEPDGAGYRDCLWDVVNEKEAAYAKTSPTSAEIDEQCQSATVHLGGLVAGEVVLSCSAFKLSQ